MPLTPASAFTPAGRYSGPRAGQPGSILWDGQSILRSSDAVARQHEGKITKQVPAPRRKSTQVLRQQTSLPAAGHHKTRSFSHLLGTSLGCWPWYFPLVSGSGHAYRKLPTCRHRRSRAVFVHGSEPPGFAPYQPGNLRQTPVQLFRRFLVVDQSPFFPTPMYSS